ncbi:hypothetical protein V6Z12_D12G185400 [Gossypium hirsutum]
MDHRVIRILRQLTYKSPIPTPNGVLACSVANPYESFILHQSREWHASDCCSIFPRENFAHFGSYRSVQTEILDPKPTLQPTPSSSIFLAAKMLRQNGFLMEVSSSHLISRKKSKQK